MITPTEHRPSEAEIDALAASVGVTFPPDYRAFLMTVGSLLVEVDEELWPRPDIGDVAPHWKQTRFGLRIFGVCSEVEWMRIEDETRMFREDHGELAEGLAPVFAWANTSDRICFDASGALVEWTRDEGATPLGESFGAVTERLLAEQAAYKDEL